MSKSQERKRAASKRAQARAKERKSVSIGTEADDVIHNRTIKVGSIVWTRWDFEEDLNLKVGERRFKPRPCVVISVVDDVQRAATVYELVYGTGQHVSLSGHLPTEAVATADEVGSMGLTGQHRKQSRWDAKKIRSLTVMKDGAQYLYDVMGDIFKCQRFLPRFGAALEAAGWRSRV